MYNVHCTYLYTRIICVLECSKLLKSYTHCTNIINSMIHHLKYYKLHRSIKSILHLHYHSNIKGKQCLINIRMLQYILLKKNIFYRFFSLRCIKKVQSSFYFRIFKIEISSHIVQSNTRVT